MTGSTGILKDTGIMDHACVYALGDLLCDLSRIHAIVNKFTGRRCICHDLILIRKCLITDMVVNADRPFCCLKKFDRIPKSCRIPTI